MENEITLDNIKSNVLDWVYTYISPDFEFRKYQLESIMYVIKSILLDDRHNQIIEAPTGSGKSLICIICAGVLSKFYGKTSYILCSDLFLWRQYANAIDLYRLEDFGYLKGLSNYKCSINKQEVKYGKCKLDHISYTLLRKKDWREQHHYTCVNKCKYMQERFKAENAKVTLMTYQLWLYHMNIVNNDATMISFRERDVIFCDECHNIPEIVQSFCAPIFNGHKDIDKLMELLYYAEENNLSIFTYLPALVNIEKLQHVEKEHMHNGIIESSELLFNNFYNPPEIKEKLEYIYDSLSYLEDKSTKNILEVLNILFSILSLIRTFSDDIEQIVKKESFDTYGKLEGNIKKINSILAWFTNYYTYVKEFIDIIVKANDEYLVLESTEDRETTDKTFSFSCAKEDMICFNKLLKHAKYKVMLSATVGLQKAFDDNIGIKYTSQQSSIMSKIPSTFDFSKSPIYYIPTYKMSVSNKKHDFPIIMNICFKILRAYKQRGIIHTGSYENALSLYHSAPADIKERMIVYNGSKEKEDVLQNYIYRPDAILLGPTLIEGIDLPNDLCRFNIILKVPYPNITGKLIKRKMELFPLWYDSTTSNDIIQSVGRGVRNENDYCTTYILDGCFSWLYQKTKEQYPADFQQRLKYINC